MSDYCFAEDLVMGAAKIGERIGLDVGQAQNLLSGGHIRRGPLGAHVVSAGRARQAGVNS